MLRSKLAPVVLVATIGLAGGAASAAAAAKDDPAPTAANGAQSKSATSERPGEESASSAADSNNNSALTGSDDEVTAKKKAYDSKPRPAAKATAAEAAWKPLFAKRIGELEWATNYKPTAASLVKGNGDELARVEMDQPTASSTVDAINQCSWAMLARDQMKSRASSDPALAGLAKLRKTSPLSKEGVNLLTADIKSGNAGAVNGFIDANSCTSVL